jgi:transposase
MDEARFGTHSKLGHGWFPTGIRSRINVRLGFKNFYLYGAIEPTTGEAFTLLLPSTNTEIMSIFLEQFSQKYPEELITLIMDGAGWHKAKKLRIPKNIKIVFLPPYCPELNPVERFWLYIKKAVLRNKIYHSLDHLKDAVCSFLNSISSPTIMSLCSSY